MGNIDAVEAQKLAAASLVGTTYTVPPGFFVALDTVQPADANSTATELTGYTRQSVVFSTPAWNSTSKLQSTSNTGAVTFATMPATTVTGIEIFSTVSGTTRRLWWGPLAANKATAVGDTLTFAVGSITATLG
jgi:hypothetical protein